MNPITLLLVDDDEEIREPLADHLKRLGCTVVEAKDGKDGLVKFKSGKFDLVITDNDMPNMCGFELIKAIKEICNVPIAMITGGMTTKEIALEGGADEFFAKPFHLGELELFILQAEVKQHFAS
jgi:DNA-binding response OmpR family regulator